MMLRDRSGSEIRGDEVKEAATVRVKGVKGGELKGPLIHLLKHDQTIETRNTQ